MAYIVASGIKGLTGLGFSTSCLPILALRLDLKVAIPLVIIPSIVSNVTLMIQAGRFREVVRRFWPLYVATIPGLLVGLFILISINVDVARAILGLVLVAYTLLALSNRPFSLSGGWERKLKIVVGLSTGFVNGLTGSQVMPVLPYLMSLNLHRGVFVQAINISFTLSSIVMLFSMNHLGYMTANTVWIAVISLAPVLVTVHGAGILRNRLSGTLYRNLILIFLLIMGAILSVRSFL
ncbi:MAG: sulfite exporter TauE/SafE family protein [Desulfobacterales bacterium]|nr:sulfite exporter TauE/SafE family protein [Desulfobacterales bacterium]